MIVGAAKIGADSAQSTGVLNTTFLMGSEEMAYLNTKKILEQQMIDYYRQMFRRGYISTDEVKFLK